MGGSATSASTSTGSPANAHAQAVTEAWRREYNDERRRRPTHNT
ncbi:MAG: hypothetical protein AB7L71_15545 [Vicinamibacterales bacterium]